jgi:hypothetical protein
MNDEAARVHKEQCVHVFVGHDRLTEHGMQPRSEMNFCRTLLSVRGHHGEPIRTLPNGTLAQLAKENSDVIEFVRTQF